MASIKVCFHSGFRADEIRRFSIESVSYDLLVSKIKEVFPFVGDKEFSLQWKDGDDFVTFSSDEELAIAFGVVEDGVLYVLVRLAGEEHHFDCPYLDKLHHCPYLMKCLCGEEPHHSTGERSHGCPYLEMIQGSGCPYLKKDHFGYPYLGNWQGTSHFRGKCPLGFGYRGGCPLGFGASGWHRGCPLGFSSHGFGHHGGCPFGFGHHGMGRHDCDEKEKGSRSCPVKQRPDKPPQHASDFAVD